MTENDSGMKRHWAPFIGALILVALAFAIGRISAPDEEASSSLSVAAAPDAELETSYPHSPAGASLAAAAYQRALADPAILRRAY
jgi:hypothetical protein